MSSNTTYASPNTTPATNTTSPSAPQELVAWFAFVVMLMSMSLNGVCLIAFIHEKRLRTSFNYYLINLTVSDLAYAIFSMPFFVVLNHCGYWPLGRNVCAFYQWADWMFSASVCNTVLLIGVDRVWAVCFPFHYRDRHSKKLSTLFIATMWVWIFACITPGMVANRMGNFDELGCEIVMDTPLKQSWATLVNVINYLVPQILLLSAFAVVLWRVFKQRRQKIRTAAVLVSREQQKEGRVLRMFGFMTLGMCVCWGPGDIFWTMYDAMPEIYDFSTAQTIALMMYCNSVVNPLLYQTGSRDIRDAVLRLLQVPIPVAHEAPDSNEMPVSQPTGSSKATQ